MPGAIEMLIEDEIEELWQKCCGFGGLSLKDFYEHLLYDSLSRSRDPFQRLICDMIMSWGNIDSKGSRMLCIGHDDGDFLIELGRRDCEGADRDCSRAVLMKARLVKNDISLKNVEFREWDMGKSLTFNTDSVFNCIISVNNLHLLKEPEMTIREYFRMIKPSGGVILVEPWCPNEHYQILEFNEEQCRTKLEAAGFRINTVKSSASEVIATALKPSYYYKASGYRFISAETQEDLDKVFRLRYQVYCVELGVESDNASGLQRDACDEYAVHFLALDENGEPVGTLRAIPDNPSGFPMESDFPLTAYMSEKGIDRAVEGGRFAIKKALLPEARAIVGFGLMKGLIDYCREAGINDLFTTTQVKIAKRFAVTGFRQIGEPFEYAGTWAGVLWVPMHCDIGEVYKNYFGTVRGYSDLP
ncbi:MAG: GNAT family N-acetyltransferase [Nitrososphaerota archaeon]|nr:GNAT family N-acetyltransferase [Nitrososphaerota archaeon]